MISDGLVFLMVIISLGFELALMGFSKFMYEITFEIN